MAFGRNFRGRATDNNNTGELCVFEVCMSDYVVPKRLLEYLKVSQGQKTPERADARAQERLRIRNELLTLHNEIKVDFPELDVRPLELLIRQGSSITDVYKSGDIFTIDIERSDGTTGQVFQEIGARGGEVFVHSNSSHGEDATVRVKTVGRRTMYVEEGESYRKTYNARGSLSTHEEGGALHKYKAGQRLYSEDLGTGLKSFYYEGTDRVAFVENPAGQVVAIFEFDADKRFEVQLQPTTYLLAQNNRKMMARPKLRLRRLKAYKKKIRAHVKTPRVSGEFKDPANVEKLQKARQVIMVAGVVLVSNTKPLGSLQGMFGLSEGLVAAFLRSGSAYGSSVVRASSKPKAVSSTADGVRAPDDAAPVRGETVPWIVMSEGAFLAMANTQTDSPDMAREGRSVRRDGKDSSKPSVKLKGAMLHAAHKPEVSRVGAPVMMTRGSMPTLRGERYIVSRRPAIDIRMTSGIGKQSPFFSGSVLSATPGNQWVVPAALPTVNNVARVDSKTSVRETLRQPLVMKTGRSSRDSGSGSNPHHGNDDQPKKQQPKQADS